MAISKEEFKNMRKAGGFTQAELAKELGYSDYQRILEKEKGIIEITRRDELALRYLLLKKNNH